MPSEVALPVPAHSRALVPTLVFLGMVVAVVSSLGAPMIPTIAAAYRVPLADAQWSLTITLLVGALATPTMGRLGDGSHRRMVILGALGAITLGNVLAALPLGFAPRCQRTVGAAIAFVGCALWILSAIVSYVAPKRGSAAPVDEVLAEESVADGVPLDEGAASDSQR